MKKTITQTKISCHPVGATLLITVCQCVSVSAQVNPTETQQNCPFFKKKQTKAEHPSFSSSFLLLRLSFDLWVDTNVEPLIKEMQQHL